MDAREVPPPNLLEQGGGKSVAADSSCPDIQEGSVRKATCFECRPKRGSSSPMDDIQSGMAVSDPTYFLARVPKNCFDCTAHQEEQFGDTACEVESHRADSDTHSDTSASSNIGDVNEDLLDSNWDERPPVAELESDLHEREDWDKEINESEAGPYDLEDTVDNNSLRTGLAMHYFWQGNNAAYDPSCHHTLPVTFSSPVRYSQKGQFDDADE